MLDHIDDLRKLTNEDIQKEWGVWKKSFETAIDNNQSKASFLFALLTDIVQNLREINKKLKG